MIQYQELIQKILTDGEIHHDRTGVGTKSIFGYQTRFDLTEGFPAVTTKKLAWKAVVGELLWFLEGSTNERRLAELTYGAPSRQLVGKRTIWSDNVEVQGKALGYSNTDVYAECGPIYSAQWRNFNSVDQISTAIDMLKNNPDSRRIIVSAWNPGELEKMILPPCHSFFQFRVYNQKLICQVYIRSNDVMLGTPFNIASYALLTHLIAQECNLIPHELVYTIGDAHIYLNHIDAAYEVLNRFPYESPILKIDPKFSLNAVLNWMTPINSVNLITLEGYNSWPAIKLPMAV